jgi:hypothetical protein
MSFELTKKLNYKEMTMRSELKGMLAGLLISATDTAGRQWQHLRHTASIFLNVAPSNSCLQKRIVP